MLKLLQIVDEQKFLASLQWRTLVTAMAEATGRVDLQRFPLYSFVLTTPSDSVFWPLQETFQELNELTGPHVLCVAPHVDVIGAAERQRKSAIQRAASILQNGINSRAHDSTTRDSIDQQLKATYAFARLLQLPVDSLPCAALFESLGDPFAYLEWPLGTAARDGRVKDDFAKITGTVQRHSLQTTREADSAMFPLLERLYRELNPHSGSRSFLHHLPSQMSDKSWTQIGRISDIAGAASLIGAAGGAILVAGGAIVRPG